MEEDPRPAQRGEQQNYRSANSINWRVKDETQGGAEPQQSRYNRRDYGEHGQQSSRGGYGQGRRGNNDYQPREQREIPGKPESPRLYVGNLLYTAQPDDITNFFTANGFNVVNVSMSIDQMTGRNPSYCFVDLESVDDAVRAMEQLNGAEVLGRQVRINPGVARKEGQSGAPRRGFGNNERAWRDDRNTSESTGYNRPSSERWGRGDSSQQQQYQQSYSRPQESSGKRLYVGGLPPIEPQSAVESEMQTLFSRIEPPVEIGNVSNLIAPHPSKASEPGDHHYLFIDLKTESDADRAIESLNDIENPWSDGGRLKVNKARENRDRRGPREGGLRENTGRGYGGGAWRNDA